MLKTPFANMHPAPTMRRLIRVQRNVCTHAHVQTPNAIYSMWSKWTNLFRSPSYASTSVNKNREPPFIYTVKKNQGYTFTIRTLSRRFWGQNSVDSQNYTYARADACARTICICVLIYAHKTLHTPCFVGLSARAKHWKAQHWNAHTSSRLSHGYSIMFRLNRV